MTVASNKAKVRYSGDGSTVAFDLGSDFIFFNASELVVTLRVNATGAETVKTLTTHYTVSGGSGATGTVTMLTAPAVGETLIIERIMPLTQGTDLVENSASSAEVIEDALDKLTLADQQLDEGLSRALKVSSFYTSSTFDPELTLATAGAYLRIKSDGSGLETVTGDPNTSTYTQSGTGATERTVNAKLSDIVSVKDYGATGDGATDDSAAFQSWLTYICDNDKAGFIPAGNYVLGSQVTWSGAEVSVKIFGDGVGVSKITVPETNTDGAISIASTDRTSNCTVHDIEIIADGESLGTGFEFTVPEGGNQHRRNFTALNFRVHGNAAATDYFDVGINVTGCWRPLFQNVIVGGPFGSGISDDYATTSYQYKMTTGIDADGCYSPSFQDCYVWSANVGISSISTETTGPEGFHMNGTKVVGVRTALDFSRDSAEPELWINNCHWNYRDIGLKIGAAKFVQISNCLPYNTDAADVYSSVPYDIRLQKCSEVIIHNNIFHFDGHSGRFNIFVDSTTSADQVTIHSNVFNSLAAEAIRIGGTTTDAFIFNNEFPGTITTKVNDASNNALIMGRAGNNTYDVENQNDGATGGPVFRLFRRSASPADNDGLGQHHYIGMNDAATPEAIIYAYHQGVALDITDGTEDGDLQTYVMRGGSLTQVNSYGTDRYGATSTGTTGGTGSAGAGNQYVQLTINGTTYKVLHDGTV